MIQIKYVDTCLNMLMFAATVIFNLAGIYAQEPVAITVSRNVPETEYKNPLNLPIQVVDFGDAWDRFGYTLTVPINSTYMFHLNAGANQGKRVNMNLRGALKNTDVYRGSTSHNGTDTTGRLFISHVDTGNVIYTVNEQDYELFSDVGMQTSFTAIDMERFVSAVQRKVFSVARREDSNILGRITFTELIVNLGGDFDIDDSEFTVKETGFHFFTFSAGVKPHMPMRAQITSRDQGMLTEVWHRDTSHDGTLIVSKCVMAELTAGDGVYVQLLDGELYSDAERQTTFAGFHYDPVLGPKMTWSVYSVVSTDASSGSVDPLPFHGSLANTGMFDFNTMQVNITMSGLYYAQLSVHAQKYREVNARVVTGDDFMEFSIDRSSTSHTDFSPLMNGRLIELYEGNRLKVQLNEGSYAFSNAGRLTSFTGFLVYPFPAKDGNN